MANCLPIGDAFIFPEKKERKERGKEEEKNEKKKEEKEVGKKRERSEIDSTTNHDAKMRHCLSWRKLTMNDDGPGLSDKVLIGHFWRSGSNIMVRRAGHNFSSYFILMQYSYALTRLFTMSSELPTVALLTTIAERDTHA
jgi:hypothetical protein